MLLLRRTLVSFTGDELTIGIFLTAWTFWTACGSWVGGKLAHLAKDRERTFVIFFLAYLVTFASTFIAIYLIKHIIGVALWEEVGVVKMIKTSFLTLAPMCFILGALFPLAVQLLPSQAGEAVSNTYSWEAFGAGAGGITANLLALVLKPMEAVWAICAFALLILALFSKKRWRVALFLVFLLLIAGVFSVAFDDYLLLKAWRDYSVKFVRDTRYSNLALAVKEDEATLFSDGAPIISLPAGAPAEEIGHIPMLLHSNPKSVLLIGGSLLTIGREILKYPIESLDYCQLDPDIVAMERRLCDTLPGFCENPTQEGAIFDSSKLRIHLIDGRRFIKESASSLYDVIIFDVGAPHTLGLNRYFTRETFALAKNALKEGGIICFGAGEYANYIDPSQGRFLALLKKTVNSVFGNVTILPFGRFYFVAGRDSEIEASADIFDHALTQKHISTVWFKSSVYRANLTEERVRSVSTTIEKNRVETINADYHPLGFVYWINYWSTLFYGKESKFIEKIMKMSPRWLLFTLMGFGIIGTILVLTSRGGSSEKIGIAWAMGGTGFAEMCLSVAILYATQLRLGTLFFLIGFLVTSLMIGMGIGGLTAQRASPKRAKSMLLFSVCGLMVSTFLIGVYLPPLLQLAGDLWAILLLNAIALCVSFLGGFAYASSAKVGEKHESGSALLGGLINSADLFGTACGAVLAGTVMIPIWGFTTACVMASGAVFISLIVCALSFARNKEEGKNS